MQDTRCRCLNNKASEEHGSAAKSSLSIWLPICTWQKPDDIEQSIGAGKAKEDAMKTLIKKAVGAAGYRISRKRDDQYDEDGLRSDHDHEFANDPRFIRAYASAISATNNDPQRHGPWRVHVALWAAHSAFRLGGDFVECGVYRGFVSSAIMNYLDWNVTCGARRFFLFDTFDGFVPELLDTDEQGRFAQFGDKYKGTYKSTTKAFSGARHVNVVKGIVPQSLTTQNIASVSYLHLDMNCAAPEVAALEHFWPKLPTGALVLMDDYAYTGFRPQYVALNRFADKVGYQILSLPTGQGLLIK